MLEQREHELADARASADGLHTGAARAEGRAEALGDELDNTKAALERLRGDAARTSEELRGARANLEDALSDASFLRLRLENREAELTAETEKGAAAEAARLKAEQTKRDLRPGVTAADSRRAAMQREPSETRSREQALMDTTLTLRQVSDHLHRIEQSRSWRFGHGLFRWLRIITFRKPLGKGAVAAARVEVERALKSAEHGRASRYPARSRPSTARDAEEPPGDGIEGPTEEKLAELARQVREAIGGAPEIDPRPVSILVVNRNGRAYMERLLGALCHRTDYPQFELIVIDNASTDGSIELLQGSDTPFPLKVVLNDRNESFSEANNQAAERADGDLLLLLNNDVQPVEPGWLNELVACHDQTGAGAVGAILVHADADRPTRSGWEVQQRGIRFRREDGMLKGFNEGAGDDVLDCVLRPDPECPAVTAACLLVSTGLYWSLGGLHPGYRYGSEDIDFCLSLQERGEAVVCCGRAVLLHVESASQKKEGREVMRTNRLGNRQLFHERWGPRLWRQASLDRFADARFWTPDAPPRIAITRTSNDPGDGYGDWYTAEEIGNALAREGFAVEYIEARRERWHSSAIDADYVLSLLDRYDPACAPVKATTIAWIRNWTERWVGRRCFPEYSVVLASSTTSVQIAERETGRRAVLFPLATNPERFRPVQSVPRYESDYVFAGNRWGVERPIEGALRVRRGERARIFGKGWSKSKQVAHLAEGPVSYDELPAVYSSTRIVLDDASLHTLPYDSVNSRVFDALASGAVVLTNCERGVREVFDDAFPTYSGADSLRAWLDQLLRDEWLRRTIADRYRRQVLRGHTYAHRARELRALLEERLRNLRFCIKIAAPGWEVANQGGDVHFARAIQRELRARGHDSVIQVLSEWDNLEGLEYDVALHLRGVSRYRPKPGQLNVLWSISHPDLLTGAECDAYDLVFVASTRFAGELRSQTNTPLHVLEQATDARLFRPERDERSAHGLVFVGNSRRIKRRILEDLLPTNHDLAVWGRDWEGLIPSRHVMGRHLEPENVRKVYSSAAIVLNDHWDDMRQHGFVSNRIYDALACGAFVISDRLPEIEDRFNGAVVTYEGRDELCRLIDRYIDDRAERDRLAQRGRELVVAEHTFERRVKDLLSLVEARWKELHFSRTIRAEGGRPDAVGEEPGRHALPIRP